MNVKLGFSELIGAKKKNYMMLIMHTEYKEYIYIARSGQKVVIVVVFLIIGQMLHSSNGAS